MSRHFYVFEEPNGSWTLRRKISKTDEVTVYKTCVIADNLKFVKDLASSFEQALSSGVQIDFPAEEALTFYGKQRGTPKKPKC